MWAGQEKHRHPAEPGGGDNKRATVPRRFTGAAGFKESWVMEGWGQRARGGDEIPK